MLVDVIALVEIERAGELLDVDHVRQVLVAEPEHRERAPRKALVRTSADLLDSALEVLDKVQKRLTGSPYPEATMLWNHGKSCKGDGDDKCRPRSEDDISDHIACEARDLLPHYVINREVQINRHTPSGLGERVETPRTATEASPNAG